MQQLLSIDIVELKFLKYPRFVQQPTDASVQITHAYILPISYRSDRQFYEVITFTTLAFWEGHRPAIAEHDNGEGLT